MFVPLRGAQIWRLPTEPFKFEWNISANNSQTEHHTDLRLGEIVYYLIFYHNYLKYVVFIDKGLQIYFLIA